MPYIGLWSVMWVRFVFFLLAVFVYAQVVTGGGDRGVVFLGSMWESPPRVGGVGVLDLMFFLRERHIDVTVEVRPLCGFVEAVSGFRATELGPGAVAVKVSLWAGRFNVSCSALVVYRWRYVDRGAALGDGGEVVEPITLSIPPAPGLSISVSGVAVLGVPSVVNVSVTLRGVRGGILRVAGDGVKVLSPHVEALAGPGVFSTSLVVLAESPSPSLAVSFEGVDAAGQPVRLSSAAFLPTAPRPAVVAAASPAQIPGRGGRVNVTVQLPGPYDGVAYIRFIGAAAGFSVYVVDLRGGRGSASVFVVPTSDVVEVRAEVQYVVGGVVRSEQVSLYLPVLRQPVAGRAKVSISPALLASGVVNDVAVSVSAPGGFNASVVFENAAVDRAMPYIFGGFGNATARFGVVPLGRSVAAVVEVWGGDWRESYRVELPVAEGGAFVVKPLTNEVPAGSTSSLPISVMYTGLEAVRAVLFLSSPVSPTAVYELELSPQKPVVVNYSMSIPAHQSGVVKVDYEIYYATQRGAAGRSTGSFFISAYQKPRVALLSAEVSPRRPTAGSPFFVVLSLYNGGFAEAYNINVTVSPIEGLVPVTPTRQVVGRLAPQGTSVASFGFNATGPLVGNVTVRVEYVDAYGRKYLDDVAIPIAVYARQSEKQGGSPGWTGLAALAAVAAVLLVVALKGGRKARPGG